MTYAAVDLFGGPGGWAEAMRLLGLTEIGVETDAAACETRRNAGHAYCQNDVSRLDPMTWAGISGVIGSPPCPAFSTAGNQEGREHLPALIAAIHRRDWAARPDPDPRIWLSLEMGRWWEALQPEWVALEQVPAVLPLWGAYAHVLRNEGYSVWTGILNAANYGIVEPCPLHATHWPTDSAECAERVSRCGTALVCAEGLATTSTGAQLLRRAVTVVADWAKEIRQACVVGAMADERQLALVASRVAAVLTIPRGAVADASMTEAMSGFGLTPDTAESIASWLSACLADLSPDEKSCTTSTRTHKTIAHRISRCIAATLITGSATGTASRSAGCGLCVDVATPQIRKRAILMASRTRPVHPPTHTHAKDPVPSLFGQLERWVTMAAALGWGMPGRPGMTLTHSAGGPDPTGSGGSGARARLYGEREEGRWIVSTGLAWEPDGTCQEFDAATEPARTVTATTGGQWWLNPGVTDSQPNRRRHKVDAEPAPTVAFGHDAAGWQWETDEEVVRTGKRDGWEHDRPANDGRNNDEMVGRSDEAIRITIRDALILQSFRPDYPVAGNKTKQFEQIGNACPVLLAKAILEVLV